VVAYIFQKIADKGTAAGITDTNTADARNWFRSSARKINTVNDKRIMGDRERLTNKMSRYSIGRMFMFYYDPKTKDQLPYWDRFPLIFPIELYPDGFLGINLHYIPPLMRARLMNALYLTTNNKLFDDTTRLRINYNILKSASRFKYFQPCVKRYLFSHVRSRYYYVAPNEWDMALMLPTERFVGAQKAKVFRESSRMIT
jgi:hypothetical protein